MGPPISVYVLMVIEVSHVKKKLVSVIRNPVTIMPLATVTRPHTTVIVHKDLQEKNAKPTSTNVYQILAFMECAKIALPNISVTAFQVMEAITANSNTTNAIRALASMQEPAKISLQDTGAIADRDTKEGDAKLKSISANRILVHHQRNVLTEEITTVASVIRVITVLDAHNITIRVIPVRVRMEERVCLV